MMNKKVRGSLDMSSIGSISIKNSSKVFKKIKIDSFDVFFKRLFEGGGGLWVFFSPVNPGLFQGADGGRSREETRRTPQEVQTGVGPDSHPIRFQGWLLRFGWKVKVHQK